MESSQQIAQMKKAERRSNSFQASKTLPIHKVASTMMGPSKMSTQLELGNVIARYQDFEAQSPRLQNLIHKFSTEKDFKLASVQQSVYTPNESSLKKYDPNFNIIKNGVFNSSRNSIQGREVTGFSESIKKYDARKRDFSSKIDTIPGPEMSAKLKEGKPPIPAPFVPSKSQLLPPYVRSPKMEKSFRNQVLTTSSSKISQKPTRLNSEAVSHASSVYTEAPMKF